MAAKAAHAKYLSSGAPGASILRQHLANATAGPTALSPNSRGNSRAGSRAQSRGGSRRVTMSSPNRRVITGKAKEWFATARQGAEDYRPQELAIELGVEIDAQDENGATAVVLAAANGHTGMVEALIAAGAKLDVQDNGGMTALYHAAANGQDTTTKALVDCRSNVDVLLIARKGNARAMETLIRVGSNPWIEEKDTRLTALMYAAREGHAGVCDILIRSGSKNKLSIMNCLDAKSDTGATALMKAVDKGHLGIVQALIRAGVNLDVQDGKGRKTALFFAVQQRHTAIAHELVVAGANADLKDNTGRTALMHAIEAGHTEMVIELINGMWRNRSRALKFRRDSMQEDDEEFTEFQPEWIMEGLSLQDKDGNTLLHRAIQRNQADVAAALIASGAELTIKNKAGQTVRDIVEGSGNRKLAILLLFREEEHQLLKAAKANDKEAAEAVLESHPLMNLEKAHNVGETALYIFAVNDNFGAVEMLMARGANTSTQDLDGRTALHHAAENGSAEMCRLLLGDTKVDIDQATIDEGLTALHLCCQHGYVDVCPVLLENDADADLETYENTDLSGKRNALHIAAEAGHIEVCRALVKQGFWENAMWYSTNVHAVDQRGLKPIDLAKSEEIKRLLDTEESEWEYNCGLLGAALCMDHVSQRRLSRYRSIVVMMLWLMVLVPILDIVTDWWVSFILLDSDSAQDRYFGRISFGLLLGANVVLAIFLAWWDMKYPENARFNPEFTTKTCFGRLMANTFCCGFDGGLTLLNATPGFLLSVTSLRLPLTAMLDSFNILYYGPNADDMKLPKHQAVARAFCGNSAIVFMKVFEIVLETVPQLMLTTYVIAYKYFHLNNQVELVLSFSILIGLASLSSGISLAYTCEEKLKMKIMVSIFFGLLCVARFGVHVVLFIDLGMNAAAAISCFVLVRCYLVFGRYKAYFEEHWGAVSPGICGFIFAVGWIDIFLSYFFTIATDDNVKGRLENDQMRVILAITGPLEKATVNDKLLSWPALRLLGIHVVEILIGWGLVLSFDAGAGHTDVGLWYAMVWGLAPVVLALLTLVAIWCMPKKGERSSAVMAVASATPGAAYLAGATVVPAESTGGGGASGLDAMF